MLKDISAGGASVDLGMQAVKGKPVALEIEDMEPLEGRIARTFDDGFAVEFDLDEDDEDRLIADLTVIRNSLRREDE